MVDRYRGAQVPAGQSDPELSSAFDGVTDRVGELLDAAELSQALEEIWKLVRRLNQYVEESRPWDLAKDGAAAERLDTVLYNLAEGLRVTTLLLLPYLPETADRLLDALGEPRAEPERPLSAFGDGGGGQRIEKLPPLFPKLEAQA
jgi:methionyl-tRNA synthetase